jgi:acetyltransferase-like isoleucine patch superfamily enzyme
MNGWRLVVALLSMPIPWGLRRRILTHLLGYKIHPTAHIGWSLILARRVELGERAFVGHFNVCKGVDLLRLGLKARIGNLNWITGAPTNTSGHFAAQEARRPELIVAEHAALTNRHLVDCTNSVLIGRFSTVAGFRSQLLTHSIDIREARQWSSPIEIGEYCFVGTGCIMLGGSHLPNYSVLAAGSVLRDRYDQERGVYAGVPAIWKKDVPEDWKYFSRTDGYVW